MKAEQEKTLIIIKPDAVQRSLIGEIIKRFEAVGLKIVATKFIVPTKDLIEKHYLNHPDWKKEVGKKAWGNKAPPQDDSEYEKKGEWVLEKLKRFMCAGPTMPMVLEGAHAVALTRKIVGGTEPLTSDVGTIRGDFVIDSYSLADGGERAIRNLIHASSSIQEAENEIALWFKKEEVIDYTTAQEKILYDLNFDA